VWLATRGGTASRWLLALAALAFAPAVNAIRWYGTLGERYLYLPLAFAVAALVAAVRPGRAAAALLSLATVASIAALHVRVPEWATEETLFRAAVRRAPDAYARNMLALELARTDRPHEAWPYARDALDAAPLYTTPCRHVVRIASEVLAPAAVAELVPGWAGRGCRFERGFDGSAAVAYAAAGRWADADAIVRTATMSDPQRRISLVRGVLAARDHDWAAMGDDAFAWPGGVADYLDRVAAIVLDRSDPTVAPPRAPL
jgi:hypothetical protein